MVIFQSLASNFLTFLHRATGSHFVVKSSHVFVNNVTIEQSGATEFLLLETAFTKLRNVNSIGWFHIQRKTWPIFSKTFNQNSFNSKNSLSIKKSDQIYMTTIELEILINWNYKTKIKWKFGYLTIFEKFSIITISKS